MAESPDPEIEFRDRNLELGQGDVESGAETQDESARENSPVRERQCSPTKRYRGRSPHSGQGRQSRPRYSSASPENRPGVSPYRRVHSPDYRLHAQRKRDASCHYRGPTLKPDPYSGQENWEEYISHFENCADLCQWNHQQKVLMLAASLRGQARTYYMSLSLDEKIITNHLFRVLTTDLAVAGTRTGG